MALHASKSVDLSAPVTGSHLLNGFLQLSARGALSSEVEHSLHHLDNVRDLVLDFVLPAAVLIGPCVMLRDLGIVELARVFPWNAQRNCTPRTVQTFHRCRRLGQ